MKKHIHLLIPAMILFAVCISSIGQAAPKVNHAEKAYQAGLQAYEQGEYQKAVYAFQNSIGFNEKFYKSYYMLGLALFMNNEPESAEQVLQQAITDFPKEWKAQVVLAEYYAGQKKYESAIAYYDKVLDSKNLSKKDKEKYQAKKDEIIAERSELWRVSEEEKEKILKQVKLPLDMKVWRAALVEKQNSNLHLSYLPKDEDLTTGKWKIMIDVLCKTPELGGFEQINQETADQYRELGADLNTLEQVGDSRIFETRLPNKTYIIGRLYKSSVGYCLIQVMKKGKFKEKDTEDWITKLKTVIIQSPE